MKLSEIIKTFETNHWGHCCRAFGHCDGCAVKQYIPLVQKKYCSKGSDDDIMNSLIQNLKLLERKEKLEKLLS